MAVCLCEDLGFEFVEDPETRFNLKICALLSADMCRLQFNVDLGASVCSFKFQLWTCFCTNAEMHLNLIRTSLPQ